MLRNLENMARSGNREMAEQMLSQLRDLLDRLQSGRMADQGQSQRFGKMMDEFGNIIGRQQQLLDDTFGQQRQGEAASVARRVSGGSRARGSRARVQGEGGDQAGRPGRQPERPPARAARHARPAAARHARVRHAVARTAQWRRRSHGTGRAGLAQRRSQWSHRRKSARARTAATRCSRDGPADAATDAVALRAQRQRAASSIRWAGRRSAPTAPIPASGVKVPDQIDIQRAREILEELRRRLGETDPAADGARVPGAPAQALLSSLRTPEPGKPAYVRRADLGSGGRLRDWRSAAQGPFGNSVSDLGTWHLNSHCKIVLSRLRSACNA